MKVFISPFYYIAMPAEKKPVVKCSYCRKKSFYIFHKDKKTKKIDWAICFKCLKKFCDKILGEAKDGGRIE